MNHPAISVRHVQKSFGKKNVLADVSFDVTAGETLAFLGRNGAGKTTLIQILLGLLPPDAGSINVAGCDSTREAVELRRRVGYLAEDQMMYGWMTPIELCRFLQPFYPSWNEKLAAEYLERFEIPRQTRIGRLSKGQAIKLGLAVALAHKPQVAIFDDPALGLDPIARKEFNRHLIEHLQAEGRTVLYSSHLLAEVETVADSVAILHDGRIIRHAPIDVVREEVKQYIIPLDAARTLEPPEKLLDVARDGQRLRLVIDQGEDFEDQLVSHGVEHEVQNLTLDEIFEAFVIGRQHDWPSRGRAVSTV